VARARLISSSSRSLPTKLVLGAGRLCRGDTGASLDAGEGGAASSGGNLPEEISSHETVAGDQEYAFLRVRGDGRDGAVVAEVEKRALETLLHPRGAEHPA
jgi:hypothetical protein